MHDIHEPVVILADGEQWKSDVELLKSMLTTVTQYLSEHEKLPVTFFRLVSEGNVNITIHIICMYTYSADLRWCQLS